MMSELASGEMSMLPGVPREFRGMTADTLLPRILALGATGTVMHVGMELFNAMANIKLLHVPYNGSGPSTLAVIGGQVPLMFIAISPSLPHIKAGRLRALGVTTPQRTAAAPDVPTISAARSRVVHPAPTFEQAPSPSGGNIVLRM